MTKPTTARWLAFLLPAALLAGAWGAQLLGGLYPCQLCHWQRWPHYAALVLAGVAFLIPAGRGRGALVLLAALAIAASGAIAVAHAGVESGWWPGFTACSSTVDFTGLAPAQRLDAIMKAPLVRCDHAPWTLAGISLAGFNAIFSIAGAITILALMMRKRA
ncbi:disulfide bond formation protein [Sphingomonas sp. Leaf339]|uniref:disulfide bond formation protein B n=1 Tax=Sphingomonas sp. Leaf339 TaxID=1736343 RepID=UPI0007003658|nr:disulfide bond formation protein B [Sphingomonas sp. Leaf339]KQU61924.1 disulfide bond formation protein [Sphingomonas sp. Leaf339]